MEGVPVFSRNDLVALLIHYLCTRMNQSRKEIILTKRLFVMRKLFVSLQCMTGNIDDNSDSDCGNRDIAFVVSYSGASQSIV